MFSPEVADALRTFINEAKNLPDWADPDLMREAQRLFSDNPLLAYPLLAFLSLPVLYTCGARSHAIASSNRSDQY